MDFSSSWIAARKLSTPFSRSRISSARTPSIPAGFTPLADVFPGRPPTRPSGKSGHRARRSGTSVRSSLSDVASISTGGQFIRQQVHLHRLAGPDSFCLIFRNGPLVKRLHVVSIVAHLQVRLPFAPRRIRPFFATMRPSGLPLRTKQTAGCGPPKFLNLSFPNTLSPVTLRSQSAGMRMLLPPTVG